MYRLLVDDGVDNPGEAQKVLREIVQSLNQGYTNGKNWSLTDVEGVSDDNVKVANELFKGQSVDTTKTETSSHEFTPKVNRPQAILDAYKKSIAENTPDMSTGNLVWQLLQDHEYYNLAQYFAEQYSKFVENKEQYPPMLDQGVVEALEGLARTFETEETKTE